LGPKHPSQVRPKRPKREEKLIALGERGKVSIHKERWGRKVPGGGTVNRSPQDKKNKYLPAKKNQVRLGRQRGGKKWTACNCHEVENRIGISVLPMNDATVTGGKIYRRGKVRPGQKPKCL